MRTLGGTACHSPFQLFQPVVPLKILLPPGLPLMEVLHLLDLVKKSQTNLCCVTPCQNGILHPPFKQALLK